MNLFSLLKKTLYVTIRENCFSVRNLEHTRPFAAHANPPFSHPRSLIGDFTAAEACLKPLIKKALGNDFVSRSLVLSTTFILHPLEKLEGGMTQIELRALRELAIVAGATRVILYLPENKGLFGDSPGKELGDKEIAELLKLDLR